MSRRLPPSQRPGRNHGDDPGRHPSHSDLCFVVDRCEPLLRERWAARLNDDDVLVLADIRREECAAAASHQLGREAAERVAERAQQLCGRPMVVFFQPAAFLDALGGDGDHAHREAAKELRGFAALSWTGIVPLLVFYPGGLWATQWAAPGSNAMVVRYVPDPVPEQN